MTRLQKYSPEGMFPANFFPKGWMDWFDTNFSTTDTTLPSVNVKEDKDKFEIEVAAPGMKKEDFKINLDENRLTILSERKEEKSEEDKNYTRREFSYQSFSRSFNIPEGRVMRDKIVAKYNDGILSIKLPKREEGKAKLTRQIKIS